MMSSTSGIKSSFVIFIISMEGEQAWHFTPASCAVWIISLMLGIFILSIFLLIIRVASWVIPGIIPRMFGIGIAGLPTGETFRLSTVFFRIMLIPQNVK